MPARTLVARSDNGMPVRLTHATPPILCDTPIKMELHDWAKNGYYCCRDGVHPSNSPSVMHCKIKNCDSKSDGMEDIQG